MGDYTDMDALMVEVDRLLALKSPQEQLDELRAEERRRRSAGAQETHRKRAEREKPFWDYWQKVYDQLVVDGKGRGAVKLIERRMWRFLDEDGPEYRPELAIPPGRDEIPTCRTIGRRLRENKTDSC